MKSKWLLSAALMIAMAGPGLAKEPVLDRVEVIGVTRFTQADVEAAVEVGPGERISKAKSERTAENLKTLYRSRGFEQAEVHSKVSRGKAQNGASETVLEFRIVEGKPTRVSKVGFTPSGVKGEALQRLWRKLEVDLPGKTGIGAGDVFDQEKIGASRRALLDALAGAEFIGARIEDVRVSNAKPVISPEPTARWVDLNFVIDLGDRVTFGFRGNQVLAESRLTSLIADLRLVGFGKDYVSEIASRIEDEYRSLGFAKVKVTPYTFEHPERQERHVTYAIQEGDRIRIESLNFDGNTVFAQEELHRHFQERVSDLVRNGYYSEKDVQKGADLLLEWIKSKGYLSAKLIAINRMDPPKVRSRNRGKFVRLVIYLYEGDQTVVREVRVTGARVFSETEIRQKLGIKEEQALNLFAFTEGIDALKAAYRAKGYLGVRLTNEGTNRVVMYSQENRIADISIQLFEGPQYRVSRIYTEGLSLTQENVVRRELTFAEEDVLEDTRVAESEAKLRRLGIFSTAAIGLTDDPERPDYKIIRVSVQEATPGIIEGGFGFRNDLGLRIFGQTAYTNLGGRNQTVLLGLTVNRRFENYRFAEYQLQLGYIWPWFLIPEMTFRPTLTLESTQYENFDVNSATFAPTLERRLFRNPNLTASLTYSLERSLVKNAKLNPELENGEQRIGAIIPGLRLDMRDNPVNPSSGLFATTSLEFASPALLSQRDPYPIGYYRLQFRADYYIPVMKDLIWYWSFRTGFERSNERELESAADENIRDRSGAIPTYKQFALGGTGSLRGFREQEINTQSLLIKGSLAYVNYRTQIDLPFTGSLRFGPFLDAGNLFVNRFSFGGLRYGAGLGFRYQTPVGPVNLDVGFKIDQKAGEEPYRIHFSIGVI